MAYLTDFLPLLSSAAQEKEALASPEFKEWEGLKNHCKTMLERGYFQGDSESLSNPEKLVLKQEERLLDTIWKKYQFVPRDMEDSALGEKTYRSGYTIRSCSRSQVAKDLVKFSRYPQMKLAEIRAVAEKLSLMVMPCCYLDRGKMEATVREIGKYCYADVKNIEKMISRIAKHTEQDLYVLCPVSLYDLSQVEKDTEQREVIFGGELIQVKAVLDTIAQIQKNLFAILNGDEADTNIWEIGEGSGCSENELRHLRILVETIMPIQRSLLEIARKSEDMDAWKKRMRTNHCEEVAKTLKEMSQKLSCSEEAKEALKKFRAQDIKDSKRASWVIPEAAAMTSIMFFSLPHGTSLMYGKELAKVIKCYVVDMPESFYLKRGFVKQHDENVACGLNTKIDLSL